MRKGVIDYDRRHGYRGPEAYVNLPDRPGRAGSGARPRLPGESGQRQYADRGRAARRPRRRSRAVLANGDHGQKSPATVSSSPRGRSATRRRPTRRIRRGAVIRRAAATTRATGRSRRCRRSEAAFVSVRPDDGAIRRAGRRVRLRPQQVQPRHAGAAPARVELQAVHLFGGAGKRLHAGDHHQRCAAVFRAGRQTGGEAWEPKNYDGKFEGPMRLRTALAKSKNLVTVRVLQAIGPQYAQDYITRFGFDPKLHPPYLTMALGAGVGDADADGRRLLGVRQRRLPDHAVPDQQDHRQPGQRALRSAARGRGRERRARDRSAQRVHHDDACCATWSRRARRRARMQLERKDLAGKTGTTNENVDAWFCGFNASMVGVAWIGYDQPKHARHQRDRRRGGAADLDRLHGASAEGRAREAVRASRRASCRCESTPRPGMRDDSEPASPNGSTPSSRRGCRRMRSRRAALPGAAPSRDVRDQLF